MADPKNILDNPFVVRQAGLKYGPGMGAIKGYEDENVALDDVADRNKRAASLGIKARYEVVPTS